MQIKTEQRTYDRRNERLKLKFGERTPISLGVTEDISSEGLFITTSSPLDPGTKILVGISAPNDQMVSLEGDVMWNNKAGMGVKISRFNAGRDIYMDLFKIPLR